MLASQRRQEAGESDGESDADSEDEGSRRSCASSSARPASASASASRRAPPAARPGFVGVAQQLASGGVFRPGRFVVAQPALRGGGGGGDGDGGGGGSVALLEGALRRAKTLRAEAEALHARGDARGALRKAREAAELEAKAKHPPMRHQNVNLARGDSCLASRDLHLDPNRKLVASSYGAQLEQPPMRVAYEYDMSLSMHENSGARGGARPQSAQPFASGQSRAAALEAVARGARRARKQALAHATHALHTVCTHRAFTLADACHVMGRKQTARTPRAHCIHLQALTLEQLERRHPQGSNIRCEHCHIRLPRPSTLCNACHGRHGTHRPCMGAYAMRTPCAHAMRARHARTPCARHAHAMRTPCARHPWTTDGRLGAPAASAGGAGYELAWASAPSGMPYKHPVARTSLCHGMYARRAGRAGFGPPPTDDEQDGTGGGRTAAEGGTRTAS